MYEDLIKTLKSNFWEEFTKADIEWDDYDVINTYKRLFKENMKNTEFITELALVTNWKCWYWYDMKNIARSKLYEKLWFEVDTWCLDNLKWKDKTYYIRTTD